MTQYEIYTFVLCLIVFCALTALFTTLLSYVVRLSIRLIRHGAEDEKLLVEYTKSLQSKKKNTFADTAAKVFSAVVCVLLCLVFLFSLFLNFSEREFTKGIPMLRIVKSASMAYRYEENQYLYDNNLKDQIQTFDLIVTHEIPNEFDLKLYDIVVYEKNNELIMHRIVGIEEPNEKHPNERYFLLQGDAVKSPDRFPVLYSQMHAIYRGQRYAFVGSFFAFMQSPAGYLCILLILFAIIATPIVEKKIEREKLLRIKQILQNKAIELSPELISRFNLLLRYQERDILSVRILKHKKGIKKI